MGAGKSEASETELADVQLAVTAMMVDNNLSALPSGYVGSGSATANMSAFPHATAAVITVKKKDPDGVSYQAGDKNGYLLFDHDIIADNGLNSLVRYLANEITKGTYYVDADGTVYQDTTGYE